MRVQGWWLFLLLPINALVVLDLTHAVVRPAVWLVRLSPALLMLGLVAFASFRSTAFAVRLRKELRLALPTTLLTLGFSGAVLCLDAIPEGGLKELVRTLPWVLAVVLPAATVLMPMSQEREGGTLQELLTTPAGARAFAEKFALAALVVVLSWLQLTAVAERGTELWWFALGGHLLALATAPAWFFYAQEEGTALGFVVVLPFFIAGVPAFFWAPAALPVAGLYGVTMLALLPGAVRRGVAAPSPEWMRVRSSALPWVERLGPPLWRAELRGQRDALVLGVVAAVVSVSIQLVAGARAAEAAIALVAFCAVGAMLSPVLAFTEARRLGTLESELSVRPRREVFVRRVLGSALCTVTAFMVMPLVLLAPATFSEAWHLALTLALLMSLAWTVGLAVAVHLRAVGSALAAGLCIGLAVLVAHVGLLFLASWGTQVALKVQAWPDLAFVVAALVVSVATAAGVAVRRFLSADRFEPAFLLAATALSLTHAAVLGAAGVASSVL